MISYETYKIIHYISLFIFVSSASVSLLFPKEQIGVWRKVSVALAGIFILISGFGLAARLGYVTQMPTWANIKIAVWAVLFVGGHIVAIKFRHIAKHWYYAVLALVIFNTFLAVLKPY